MRTVHVIWCVAAAAACAGDADASAYAARPGSAPNPAPLQPAASGAGGPAVAAPSAPANPSSSLPIPAAAGGAPAAAQPTRTCSPGVYNGSYDCEIGYAGVGAFMISGAVSFTLSINETKLSTCKPGAEFCDDLVISENSGSLLGQAALLFGFETMLDGALDCATGEFRASGLGGQWGSIVQTDPNDPEAWDVAEPALGTFDGELDGMHTGSGSGQSIAGTWHLVDPTMTLSCTGPFQVTLQP